MHTLHIAAQLVLIPVLKINNLKINYNVLNLSALHRLTSEFQNSWSSVKPSCTSAEVSRPFFHPPAFSSGHGPEAPCCLLNPSLTPGYCPVLPAITNRFPGAVMLCYNMVVSWMNSSSTLRVCVSTLQLLSGVSTCLRLISVPRSEETLN